MPSRKSNCVDWMPFRFGRNALDQKLRKILEKINLVVVESSEENVRRKMRWEGSIEFEQNLYRNNRSRDSDANSHEQA